MPQNDPAFYENAIRRIKRLIVLLGLVGAGVLTIWKGVRFGGGFLIGSAASYVSFWRWEHVVEAIVAGKARRPAWMLVLRLLAMLAAGYVIISLTGLNLAAAATGLLVAGVAVTFELIYELIHGT